MIRSEIPSDDYEQAQFLLQGCRTILGNKEPTEFQNQVMSSLQQIIDEFKSTMH
jgi:hypothetical protein